MGYILLFADLGACSRVLQAICQRDDKLGGGVSICIRHKMYTHSVEVPVQREFLIQTPTEFIPVIFH